MALFKKDAAINSYMDNKATVNNSLLYRFKTMFAGENKITDESLEDLLALLIQADVGIETSEKIMDSVTKDIKRNGYTTMDQAFQSLQECMKLVYVNDFNKALKFEKGKVNIILMVGVNGAGKTTTISKLANFFKTRNHSVGLIAGDTFRAGAVDQLQRWADRLEVPCITGKENEDPSSVLVKGCRYYKEHPVELIFADTAGRLQSKANLMAELAKMKKVVSKEMEGCVIEVLLVIDATTGQNGLSQAEAFLQASEVTGVILSKMDGTSKGGIVLAIKDKYNLPVRFITYGENIEAIKSFKIEDYLKEFVEGE